MMRNILLVFKDPKERENLAAVLRREIGCIVLEADSVRQACGNFEEEEICLLITDFFLPEKSGIELMKMVQASHPGTPAIVCIPFGDREAINEVLQMGAFGYINTPLNEQEALIVAARGLAFHDLQIHKERRGPKFRKKDGFHGILGQSPRMRELFDLIEKVAADDANVIILGESGTGKELVARAIHAHSARRGSNFVPLNCAAIPDELLESELFGYLKGAFTGAMKAKIGRIQYAEGGTLFLDEIGDMKPVLQGKLLRVLQEREYEPVGGVKPIPADIRIIAATHRDLEKAIAEGTFREDLFYRLSVVPIVIPPLRERKEDIPLLIEKFLQVFNRNRKGVFRGFDEAAMKALMAYHWPGNVRELENLVQRMAILQGGATAGLAALPPQFLGREKPAVPAGEAVAMAAELVDPWENGSIDFDAIISDVENRLILQALQKAEGNKKEAAKLLNIKRTTLLQKIKRKQLGFS